MPSFNATAKLLARVEHTVVIVLVVNRTGHAVAKHASRERWKRIDRVFFEKASCGRGVSFRIRYIGIGRSTKVVEFIFGWRGLISDMRFLTFFDLTAFAWRNMLHGAICSPPANAINPGRSNRSTTVFSSPRGQALMGALVSGSRNRSRKKGTLSSHGIRRKLLQSGTAIKSRYPLSLLLTVNSLKYGWSCMSQPKTREQKPNPS